MRRGSTCTWKSIASNGGVENDIIITNVDVDGEWLQPVKNEYGYGLLHTPWLWWIASTPT